MHSDRNSETINHPDGRVELRDYAAINTSPLYNEDLAPVPVAKRDWTTYNFAALWISMAHCIPTYMLASGLIAAGMNWWQALVTILLGNTIVLIPILLNSHPGTKYGIPFPVFARASYGVYGSNLPALMRAIVACGWFGIQAWIGGEALHTLFKTIIPNWQTLLGGAIGGHTPTEWISFLLFWGMNIWIIYRGMDLLRAVENWAAPYVLVMTALLHADAEVMRIARIFVDEMGHIAGDFAAYDARWMPEAVEADWDGFRARQAAARAESIVAMGGAVRDRGNVTAAAAQAGVERESFHRLLRRHGLRADVWREEASESVRPRPPTEDDE